LLYGEDTAGLRQNSGGSDGVEEEHLAEITLGLGGFEERVGASVDERLGKVGIARRHHQLLNSTHLLVNELPQLGGAVALSGGRPAARQENNHNAGRARQKQTAADRYCKISFRFVLHILVPPSALTTLLPPVQTDAAPTPENSQARLERQQLRADFREAQKKCRPGNNHDRRWMEEKS
jgi:hypothetical protein